MTDEATAQAAQPSPAAIAPQRQSLAALARHAAELLSVAAAASFLLAVIVNQMVFDRWGLSFLQVATLSDVVMSGLHLLLWSLIPLSIIFLLAYGVARVRRLRWLAWILAALASLIVLFGALALAVEWAGRSAMTVGAVTITVGKGGSAVMLLGAIVLVGLLLPSARHARRHASGRGFRRQGLFVLMLCTTLFAMVHSTVQAMGQLGYGPNWLHLVEPTVEDCLGHVLWSGERALVLSCTHQGRREDPSRFVVVYGPEGWVFRREGEKLGRRAKGAREPRSAAQAAGSGTPRPAPKS